jgi:hypothetical protein
VTKSRCYRFPNMLKLGTELGIDPHRLRVALLQAARILEDLEPIDDLTPEEIAAVKAWLAARKEAQRHAQN